MTGGRVVEHISSVAAARDHSFLGVSEFHAQSSTDAPTEPAGGRSAEITCRLAQAEMLLRHAVIVDDDRVLVPHLIDALGQPPGIDRPFPAGFLGFLFPALPIRFGVRGNPLAALRGKLNIARSTF